MKYRTTCPQCTSIFRLGADQLDAAQGWVQCSVCGAAFDARPSLLMEDGSPLPVASEPAATLEVPTVEAPVAESMLPGEAATASQPVPDMAEEPAAPTGPEAEPQAAEPPVGIAQREEPPDLPSIIIIDPNIPVTEDYGPLPQMYPPPTRPAPGPYAPVYTQAATVPAAAPLPPKARIEYSPPRPATARGASAPRRISAWVWGLASALLLVTLLAQTTYFLRDTLVSRFPQIRPAFEQACTVLGCTLSLPKNLALLQIVGSDLQTEASGRLKLTLTLGNRASHVQAWPVLVLTLTDQRNRPLARRSFAPSEYLDDPRRIAAGMPPRSEQPLILPLTVQDLAPMGFDLQLVY